MLFAIVSCSAQQSLPETTESTIQETTPTALISVVFACSDYQSDDINTVSQNLRKIALATGYDKMDGLIFCGDATGKWSVQDGINSIIADFQSVGWQCTENNTVFVQGNHELKDPISEEPIAPGTHGLSASGSHDTEDYGIFIIHYAEYTLDRATTMKTVDALETYLKTKIRVGYKKPVFIVTHSPIHQNSRNDASHLGRYFFDVINEAGNQGLNIILLFGHNHSGIYDSYLGGGSVFLTRGDTIYISNPENFEEMTEESLHFTYMNAGYVGYCRSDSDNALTGTVFEIYDNEVKIFRYSENGKHMLKSQGVLNSEDSLYGIHVANTLTYSSPFQLPLMEIKGNEVVIALMELIDFFRKIVNAQ